MDDNIGLMGALLIAMFLVGVFFFFSHNIGALKAFGRYSMSWRKIGSVSLAGFLPAIGCLSSIYISSTSYVIDNPALMAVGMATVGWVGWKCFKCLEVFAMKESDKLDTEQSAKS